MVRRLNNFLSFLLPHQCIPSRRSFRVHGLIAAVVCALSTNAVAAPKAVLWERWAQHDNSATKRIDHSPWQAFLQRYVKADGAGVNRVRYGRVSAKDRMALDEYVERLSATPISRHSRAEQLPFWINLYNALTIKVVLEHYPVASIKDIDISPGLFASGPWGKKLAEVEGTPVSLDDIEHRILRPIWKDPRIHYAVNCASIGCPNLKVRAFDASNTTSLLDEAAVAYVNHPRGAEVDGGRLYVSSIYKWFVDDFGGTDAGVIRHLMTYAKPPLKDQLNGVQSIHDDRYDWRLNDGEAK
ncbi:MAG: DUF547 domain-containing protein [Gammaproteobacteria bacterium]|nr:DUF547 domain-containing protein [Gammaproteobacteria bacterium]